MYLDEFYSDLEQSDDYEYEHPTDDDLGIDTEATECSP